MSAIVDTSVISSTVNLILNSDSSSSTSTNALNESHLSILSGPELSLISEVGTENTLDTIP